MGIAVKCAGSVTLGTHGGGFDGYQAQIAFSPEHAVSIVMLRNYSEAQPTIGARTVEVALRLAESRTG